MTPEYAYQEAERKIEEAGRSRSTELDLEYMHLTELPESIGNLSQLQMLSLNNNPLEPELAAAYRKGVKRLKAYLKEKQKKLP